MTTEAWPQTLAARAGSFYDVPPSAPMSWWRRLLARLRLVSVQPEASPPARLSALECVAQHVALGRRNLDLIRPFPDCQALPLEIVPVSSAALSAAEAVRQLARSDELGGLNASLHSRQLGFTNWAPRVTGDVCALHLALEESVCRLAGMPTRQPRRSAVGLRDAAVVAAWRRLCATDTGQSRLRRWSEAFRVSPLTQLVYPDLLAGLGDQSVWAPEAAFDALYRFSARNATDPDVERQFDSLDVWTTELARSVLGACLEPPLETPGYLHASLALQATERARDAFQLGKWNRAIADYRTNAEAIRSARLSLLVPLQRALGRLPYLRQRFLDLLTQHLLQSSFDELLSAWQALPNPALVAPSEQDDGPPSPLVTALCELLLGEVPTRGLAPLPSFVRQAGLPERASSELAASWQGIHRPDLGGGLLDLVTPSSPQQRVMVRGEPPRRRTRSGQRLFARLHRASIDFGLPGFSPGKFERYHVPANLLENLGLNLRHRLGHQAATTRVSVEEVPLEEGASP